MAESVQEAPLFLHRPPHSVLPLRPCVFLWPDLWCVTKSSEPSSPKGGFHHDTPQRPCPGPRSTHNLFLPPPAPQRPEDCRYQDKVLLCQQQTKTTARRARGGRVGALLAEDKNCLKDFLECPFTSFTATCSPALYVWTAMSKFLWNILGGIAQLGRCSSGCHSSRQLMSSPVSVSPQGPGPQDGSNLLESLLPFADKTSLPLCTPIACHSLHLNYNLFFFSPVNKFFLLESISCGFFAALTLCKPDRDLAPGTQPADISITNS